MDPNLAVKFGIGLLICSLIVAVLFKRIFGFGRWYYASEKDGFLAVFIGQVIILMIFIAGYLVSAEK